MFYLEPLSKLLPFLFLSFPCKNRQNFDSLLKEGRGAEARGIPGDGAAEETPPPRGRGARSDNRSPEQLRRERHPEETGKELCVCTCLPRTAKPKPNITPGSAREVVRDPFMF